MSPDVAARLAAAGPAVGRTETYVGACRLLGGTGLTADTVGELYRAEDGLRLSALDADSAALAAAAAIAEQAVQAGRIAHGMLSAAWQGGTGWAATEFLDRQCVSASAAVASLRHAAGVLRTLRTDLARLVDSKAEAAVRIDDRRAGERTRWLAHSRAVLSGTADDAAIATVRDEIGPYVATDICGDWVPVMVSATDSVAAAYRHAVVALGDHTPARFEIPVTPRPDAPRGPSIQPPTRRPSAPLPPPAAMPAVGAAPLPVMSAPAGVGGALPPAVSDAPLPGGLLPGAPLSGAPLPDASPTEAAKPDDRPDDKPGDKSTPESEDKPAPEPNGPPDPPEQPGPTEPPAPPDQPEIPVAQPDSASPPDPAAPLAAEAPAEPPTPCEIAAAELPQVGQ